MMKEENTQNHQEAAEQNFFDCLTANNLFACSLLLSKKMFSPWPRRGHSFLQIQPAHWKELEFLWQSGFEVSAISLMDDFMADAPDYLQNSVEVYRLRKAALEHLPFAPKSFDYVGVNLLPPLAEHNVLLGCTNVFVDNAHKMANFKQEQMDLSTLSLHGILGEALRVANKGLILQCLNRFSLAGLQRKCAPKTLPIFLQNNLWYAWRDIYCVFNMLDVSPLASNVKTSSMLLGFSGTWKQPLSMQKLNKYMVNLPLGALMQIRLNVQEEPTFTGLGLRLHSGVRV